MAAAHMQMLQAVICDAGRTDELLASAAQQLSIHSATVASSIGACAILCPAAFSPPLRELLSEMVRVPRGLVRMGGCRSPNLLENC